MDRRTILQVAAILSHAPRLQAQDVKPGYTVEQLRAALKLAGLEFREDQLKLMLKEVAGAAEGYSALRRTEVSNGVEPAFSFRAGRPGGVGAAGSGRGRFEATKVKAPSIAPRGEDLAYLPVTQLAALVRARKVSSVELTGVYLSRLKAHSPKLNCTITLTEDLAQTQAKRADEELRRGRYRGPLHGIPLGAKDLLATRGIPATWGAEPFQKQVFDFDATVVARLEQAGAVLVAKLSMGALAMGGLWFGGMTKTPWNLEQSSSGSSAGSASATAAGLVGFAIGTETLGSIVTPSVRCGVTGLRPTFGRVSRYGAMALCWTLDKIGPICRSVEDTALVLRAIEGPDGKDETVVAAPFSWQPSRPLASMRVGILKNAFEQFKGKDREVYDAALAVLEKAGVRMKPVEWLDQESRPLMTALSAEAAAAFDDITRDGRVDELKDQGPNAWPNYFRAARLIPAVEYIRAQRVRRLIMERFNAMIEPFDAIVTPPYGMLTTTNFTGHPQVVVPCGFAGGMPRGLSFVGKLFDEGSPLRVALAFEQAAGWHLKRPPIV